MWFSGHHSLQRQQHSQDQGIHKRNRCTSIPAIWLMPSVTYKDGNTIQPIPKTKWINTEHDNFVTSANQLQDNLERRGYPPDLISTARKQVETPNKEKPEKVTNTLTFITNYNPRLPNIKKILTKYQGILSEHPHTYRVSDKLQQKLNRFTSSLPISNQAISTTNACKPCRKFRCTCCPYMTTTPNFTSTTTGETYQR